MSAISAAQWESYDRDGFLKLGPTLSKAETGALAAQIEDIMLGRLSYPGMMMQLDLGGAYDEMPEQTKSFKGARLDYRKIQDLERDPLYLIFLNKAVFREACSRVYPNAEGISIYRAMFMNKPAGKGTELPWHQDGGENWNIAPDPLLTAWTALSPSTLESGAVQVVRGSHKLGLLSKKGHLISEQMAERHCSADKVVNLEAEAGESYLLHNFLIHRSGVNTTASPRMAFSVCYMDGLTRHKKYRTSYPTVFRNETLPKSGTEHLGTGTFFTPVPVPGAL